MSAPSRMQQVLTTTTSAESSDCGAHEPIIFEQAGDAFGVVLVHLAPVRADDVTATHRQESLLALPETDGDEFVVSRQRTSDRRTATGCPPSSSKGMWQRITPPSGVGESAGSIVEQMSPASLRGQRV